MRQISRKAAVFAAAATTLLATSTTALAFDPFGIAPPGPQAQSVKGKVVSGDAFFLEFQGKRAKGQPETAATGFFSGTAKPGGVKVLSFSGPITCLNVKGSSVGFYYPITKSDPAPVAAFGAGVFIYLDTDGKGNATSLSFLPAPVPRTDGCAPLPGLLPAVGKVALTGG
jgi:hypothetical protein